MGKTRFALEYKNGYDSIRDSTLHVFGSYDKYYCNWLLNTRHIVVLNSINQAIKAARMGAAIVADYIDDPYLDEHERRNALDALNMICAASERERIERTTRAA